MKKYRKKLITGLLLLACTQVGCKKPLVAPTPSNQPVLVVNARDAIAAANGFVSRAQTEYADACKANPRQTKCTYINQVVDGINATITAEEAYCGWSAGTQSQSPCVPVTTAEQGLQTAINNLNQFVTQLKGAIGQ